MCDPWDRLFSVGIDGVEVLRGTTPRTAFSVTQDITPFAKLLPGTHTVSVNLGNYWEARYSDCGKAPGDSINQWHEVSVALDLTNGVASSDLPTAFPVGWNLALLENPGGDPGCAGTNPDGIDSSRTINVPSGEFHHAAFYGFVTSHNCEEQWFLNPTPNGSTASSSPVNPCPADQIVDCAWRHTHLLIDGSEVGSWYPLPYTYALAGFVGGETPGSGPLPGTTKHQFIWWTAQQGLDQRGVHTGVGVIPPYVLDLSNQLEKLSAGSHRIEIRIDGGDSFWIASGELLLG